MILHPKFLLHKEYIVLSKQEASELNFEDKYGIGLPWFPSDVGADFVCEFKNPFKEEIICDTDYDLPIFMSGVPYTNELWKEWSENACKWYWKDWESLPYKCCPFYIRIVGKEAISDNDILVRFIKYKNDRIVNYKWPNLL